jgi:hypothetical protein
MLPGGNPILVMAWISLAFGVYYCYFMYLPTLYPPEDQPFWLQVRIYVYIYIHTCIHTYMGELLLLHVPADPLPPSEDEPFWLQVRISTNRICIYHITSLHCA